MIIGVIPARYNSTRLNGKPLKKINGVPLVKLVYDRVKSCDYFDDVFVATDDARIEKCVRKFGKVVRFYEKHINGSEAVEEVTRNKNAEIIVNIQVDKPLVSKSSLEKLINGMNNEYFATLIYPIKEDIENPNRVKVVIDKNNYALYYSRSAIPYKNAKFQSGGIYAFKKWFLTKYASLKPRELELSERLEQLRVLEYGYKIKTILADGEFVSIDDEKDLENFKINYNS